MTRALYVRTSTGKQDGLAQLHALREAAKARGWEVFNRLAPVPDRAGWEEFVDLGESGAQHSRPAIDDLCRQAKAGKVNELLVTELSRVGRDAAHVIALMDLLVLKCKLRVFTSKGEEIDPSTRAGRLHMMIRAVFDEDERTGTRERINRGIVRAKVEGTRSGKPFGRPRRDIPPDKVAKAIEKLKAGLAEREVAQHLHVPRATLMRAVRKAGG